MTQADTMPEFIKSYNEGFFGLKLKGSILPAKIVPIREAARNVLCLSYMATKDGKYLSHDLNWESSREDLIRDYPDLGCLKVGPTVGYLSVRPARQYKKGYVPANVQIYVPNQSQIRKVFPRFIATSNSKDVVWQVFNREYWEAKEAVRLMDEGEGVGFPLSKNFGLYCHAEQPHLILIHKTHDVGVYNKDGQFELFKHFGHLKEQLARETNVEARVCR